MACDHDQLYRTKPDAPGSPTRVFVDFFETEAKHRLRVPDIGGDQGRDAVFIGRLGHCVPGVDWSANGIRDLQAAAERDGLEVTGAGADMWPGNPGTR